MKSLTYDHHPATPDDATIQHATEILSSGVAPDDATVFQPGQKCLLAKSEMSSSLIRNVFQPRHMCLLAKTHVSSSQDRNVF